MFTIDYMLVFHATRYANEMKGLLAVSYSINVFNKFQNLTGEICYW